MARVGDLPRNLQDQVLALERTGYRIESLLRMLETPSPDVPQPAPIAAYVPARRQLRR
jgi:hypothetical protein